MALFQSDELRHSNPNLAVVDSDFVKGGFRTAVATVDDLYALSGKTDEPSAAGQLKEFSTIVYVTGETKYYVLKDITNVDKIAGWEVFETGGGGSGTITGGTNGLSADGSNIVLGGILSETTTTISGASNTLSLGSTGSPLDLFYACTNFGAKINNSFSGDKSLILDIQSVRLQAETSASYAKLDIDQADGIEISLSGTSNALYYNDDYSSLFVPRSIPDVDYITGYTQSAITKNSNVLSTYKATTTNYTGTTSNDFIGVSGGTTIYLPDDPENGQRIIVADIAGNAFSNNITIRSLGDTHPIIGATSATINTNYGSITFIFNGEFWSVAAFVN